MKNPEPEIYYSHTRALIQISGGLLVFSILMAGCSKATEPIEAPRETRIKAAASKGQYTGHITVSWSEVENAAYYVIYRAPTSGGGYDKVTVVHSNDSTRLVERAAAFVTAYSEPAKKTENGMDSGYLKLSYVTEKDLSKDVYIAAGQNPKLRIIIGSGPVSEARLDCVIEFPSLVTWLPTTWALGYTTGQIMSRINDQSEGMFICEPDTVSGKYLKFNSQWGPIAFLNHENSLSYSPVAHIINGDVGKSQMLIVNKDGRQIINESDFTGDLSDYLGSEIPADTVPDSIVIPRTFPEGGVYYYDDMSVERGVHYVYRVAARDGNNALLSMSAGDEGYYLSAGALNAPQNVTASQGEFPDRAVISWDPVKGDGITYRVYRAPAYPGAFDLTSALAEALILPAFEDTTLGAGMYVYRVVAFNSKGEEGKPGKPARGYRTVCLDEFVRLAYFETVVGEQRVAGALGVDSVADYDKGADADVTMPGYLSGTVNFKLVVKGLTGNGKWTYTEYSNFGPVVNGSDEITSNLSKNGDFRGKLTISGPYPGYLDYFLRVEGGRISEGSNSYFMVQLYGPEWMLKHYGAEEVRVDYSTSLQESPY